MVRSVFWLVLFVIVLSISYKIYHETYMWQITEMGDHVFPVRRGSCRLPPSYGVNPIKEGSVSIGILSMFKSGENFGWSEQLMKRVIENREAYARKHRYRIITAGEYIQPEREVAWSKLIAMEAKLSQTNIDYMVYMDMDAIVMDLNHTIEELITVSNGAELIMTEDWSGPNTGIFIIKNSPWSKKFLKLAYDQKQFDSDKSSTGIPYPFEYEQRAVHYLMDTELWQRRGLPRYNGDSAEIRRHVFLLPQCAMNSYALHPLDIRAKREVAQYKEGDFIIHFAGRKGEVKTKLMEKFLSIAEKGYK